MIAQQISSKSDNAPCGRPDRVGIYNRIRLAPCDLLSKFGPPIRLVGSAGPGWDTAHALVCKHLAMGVSRPLGRHSPLLPVMLVQAADVQRGGDSHACPQDWQAVRQIRGQIHQYRFVLSIWAPVISISSVAPNISAICTRIDMAIWAAEP